MIKKYNQFINESLLDELKGPSEEEVWNNIKELEPYDMLHSSAKNGILKGVKKALELGADIHAINDYALMISAYNGNLDIVKYLVEHGANIHADYALGWSAYWGHLDIVKYLVEHGADIHTRDNCALLYATTNNHLDVVEYIKSKM